MACPVLSYVYKFPEQEMPTLMALVAQQHKICTTSFYGMDEDDFELMGCQTFAGVPDDKFIWQTIPELNNGLYTFYEVKCYCGEGLCTPGKCRCGLVKQCKPHKALIRVKLLEEWVSSDSEDEIYAATEVYNGVEAKESDDDDEEEEELPIDQKVLKHLDLI